MGKNSYIARERLCRCVRYALGKCSQTFRQASTRRTFTRKFSPDAFGAKSNFGFDHRCNAWILCLVACTTLQSTPNHVQLLWGRQNMWNCVYEGSRCDKGAALGTWYPQRRENEELAQYSFELRQPLNSGCQGAPETGLFLASTKVRFFNRFKLRSRRVVRVFPPP